MKIRRSQAFETAWRRAVSRAASVFLIVTLSGCASVPVTGRRTTIGITEGEEDRLGAACYSAVVSNAKLLLDEPSLRLVRRVGTKMAALTGRPHWKWEFAIIRDDSRIDAICFPGGKVILYSGLVHPEDEEALAVMLGHAIAHAAARHGAERMSNELSIKMAGADLPELLRRNDERTVRVALTAFGFGGGREAIPFSSTQESEADRIGLILMAGAGYDPRGAAAIWTRMTDLTGQGLTAAWFDMHPVYAGRADRIGVWAEEALLHAGNAAGQGSDSK